MDRAGASEFKTIAKRSLAIFDLDGTLIRSDSFRTLVVQNFVRHPNLIVAAALRAAHMMNRKRFAEICHAGISERLSDVSYLTGILDRLERDVSAEVAAILRRHLDASERVVLISASPNQYVAPFAERMGFSAGYGSDWRNGKYNHLYGEAKLEFVTNLFPKSDFDWCFGISDSQSDRALLEACKAYQYWDGSLSNA